MAKSGLNQDLRNWARIGAERRLVDIAQEAAAIRAAFPELRDRHEAAETPARRKAASNGGKPKRRRRLSAAGRAKLRASLKKRWAAAKKAGKTKLG